MADWAIEREINTPSIYTRQKKTAKEKRDNFVYVVMTILHESNLLVEPV